MKIAHVKITNVLGIDSLEFSPEGFTQISGPNGAGKTSILEAIKSATGSGHDGTLLRHGADKGEVVLILDDGTEIQERITATATTRNVTRDGKKLTKPGDAIKALIDALSVNPVEFLSAAKKDRVRVLLESMPLELDSARLSQISGVPVQASNTHALAAIDAVRKQVYDDRTGTNRAVTEKTATINQLGLAMPTAPGGVDGDEDSLGAELLAAQALRDAETSRIDAKLVTLRQSSADNIESFKSSANAAIDKIKAECQAAIDGTRSELADTESKAARVRQKALDTFQAKAAPLREAINAIRSNRDAAAKRKATQETIKQMQAELEDLQTDAASQSKAIADIDAYKVELLASLPIPGLEVKDGDLYRNGVQFDRLNTAQQVDIAVELARLRAGELSIVCVDRLECLDPATLDAFSAKMATSGLQLFVTRVSGEEFAVTTK